MNGSASGDTRTGIIASKGIIVIGFGRRLIANLVDAVFVFLDNESNCHIVSSMRR